MSAHDYTPTGGWNPVFSEDDKIKGRAMYAHVIKKGYSTRSAQIIARMILYKDKYPGLLYSQEQEVVLRRAIRL